MEVNNPTWSNASTNDNESAVAYPTLEVEEPIPWLPFYNVILYHLYPLVIAGRVVHILWYVIGFIGNWLSMRIWATPKMKMVNASAVYLVAVTVSDIAFQLLHIVWFLKSSFGLQTLDVPVFCETWNVLYMIPQYASQLLVLGFTIERFISIHLPFHSERFARHQRAPREITAIVIVVTALSLPQGYFWTFTQANGCSGRPDQRNFYDIWTWVTEMVLFAFVPFATLVLNIFVVRASRKSIRQHRNDSSRESNGEPRIHHKGKTCRPSTVTLLCVSFFRIFTQLPVTIVFALQNQSGLEAGDPFMALEDMRTDKNWQVFFVYYTVRTVIELIGTSHHAFSVFIFYATTKQFRVEIKKQLSSFRNCVTHKQDTTSDFQMQKSSTTRRTSESYLNSSRTTKSVTF